MNDADREIVEWLQKAETELNNAAKKLDAPRRKAGLYAQAATSIDSQAAESQTPSTVRIPKGG